MESIQRLLCLPGVHRLWKSWDDKIYETIVAITPEMLENVQQNLIRRATTTSIESNGGHFEHRI
jgi:hypothetical protein